MFRMSLIKLSMKIGNCLTRLQVFLSDNHNYEIRASHLDDGRLCALTVCIYKVGKRQIGEVIYVNVDKDIKEMHSLLSPWRND